jgi:putative ABC transport system permease protein
LSGLSLALMALLLALAVNVGVGTMVGSFNRTFLVWLDGRLAADVYISAASNAQATEIRAWLRERPEVEAILPGGRADTQLAGAPLEVLGLPDHTTYRDSWPLLEVRTGPWRKTSSRHDLPRQRTIGATPEACGRRSHRGPGTGRQLALEIVGIYADYGNPKSQIAVNYAALTRRFPEVPLTRMGLRVASAKIRR